MNYENMSDFDVVNARRLIFGWCILAHAIMFAGIYLILT
jgi:hypothetical protein